MPPWWAAPRRAAHAGRKRSQGRALIAYDPNIRLNVEPQLEVWRTQIEWMLPRTAAQGERRGSAPRSGRPRAGRVRRTRAGAGRALVVVTRGGGKARAAWTAAAQVDVPPVKVAVVDTVGAGDTFQAALLTWLAEHDASPRRRWRRCRRRSPGAPAAARAAAILPRVQLPFDAATRGRCGAAYSPPMSTSVFLRLVAIFVVVALGWVVGKARWLGDDQPACSSALATTSSCRRCCSAPPLHRSGGHALGTVVAFFSRRCWRCCCWSTPASGARTASATCHRRPACAPSATFGNSVQVHPFAAAFCSAGGPGHPRRAGQACAAGAADRAHRWSSSALARAAQPQPLNAISSLARTMQHHHPPGGAAGARQPDLEPRAGAAFMSSSAGLIRWRRRWCRGLGADRHVAGLLRRERAQRAVVVIAAEAGGAASAGAGHGALGLRPHRPAAGRGGDDGLAAGGQQRADLRSQRGAEAKPRRRSSSRPLAFVATASVWLAVLSAVLG